MINLLPTEERLALRRLYRGRLVVTALTLFFLLIIFSLVTLLPTYFIFSERLSGLKAELAEISQRLSARGIDDLIKIVEAVNQKLKILSAGSKGFAFAEVLEKLVGRGRGLVSIQAVTAGQSGEIAVSGRAATRKNFLDFIASLEKDQFFSRVNSPISNLVAFKDIEFQITLAMASSSRAK